MGGENKTKVISNSSGCAVIWLIGWLFCMGFLKLTFWKAVVGLILWPYYLGDKLSSLMN